MSVSAKVIKAATGAPSLSGAPFNRDASLEPGVHVHWALPDALTRATLVPNDPATRAWFPGVPDLWLVTRLNPSAAGVKQRSWKAWVVDSRMLTVTLLGSWTLPSNRDAGSIHTFAGMLPSAAASDNPGWGIWATAQPSFEPNQAAYYPTARQRFGLYDDLSDLPAGAGNVSYTVIGWYSIPDHDPFAMSSARDALLEQWKLTYDVPSSASGGITKVVTPVSATPPAPGAWMPWHISVSQPQELSAAATEAAKLNAARFGTAEAGLGQLRNMQANFQVVGIHVNPGIYHIPPAPSAIVCHGSVMDVSLASGGQQPAISDSQVHLYPSVKRAMATIVAAEADGQSIDFVEMLLQDLDAQKGSAAGVIDMPGAAQALAFQSVPGQPLFYAQLDIFAPALKMPNLSAFALDAQAPAANRASTGFWPAMPGRSASNISLVNQIPNLMGSVVHLPPPKPAPLTDADYADWISQVQSTLAAAVAAAAAAGTTIDPRFVRVRDYRSKAQPATLGRASDGGGPAGAGWWLDTQDPDVLKEMLRSNGDASIHLPDVNNLYQLPGPRWYRPWSPVIVLNQADRSYRFGYDGRYDPSGNGYLICRQSGETLYSIAVGNSTVYAPDLLANARAFAAIPGLPAETTALIEESLLMDTQSSESMAAAQTHVGPASMTAVQFHAAVQGMYLARDFTLNLSQIDGLAAVQSNGVSPSPIAITPWLDPFDPLFLDANYSHPHSSLETDWQLAEDQVEMSPSDAAALNPPAGQVEVIDERSSVTATIANNLDSALVTRRTLNAQGLLMRAQNPPKGITDQTFSRSMNVLSAPLTRFDSTLFARNYRQRTGALRLNKLDLIDVFGIARSWNSGIADPASSDGGPQLSWWTELSPRLPYWARLMFRLQSAEDVNTEASRIAPPICGFLLPDFLEHAMEVYDANSQPIGRLSSDPPQLGSQAAVTLNVTFEVYPWVAEALGMTPASDPLTAIANPTLRSFVAGVAAQKLDVPAGQSPANWNETGLTALLRVVDTVRGTLDPAANTPDRRVQLIGEPLVVMVGRLWLEAANPDDTGVLTQGPTLLPDNPALPTLDVRIGDISRPDDAVMGCFIPGDTPAQSHFAPVSQDAADHAVLNGLTEDIPQVFASGVPVTHPFIQGQTNVFQAPYGGHTDVIMLSDVRGGLYATPGPLPRKKIAVPTELLANAAAAIEPVFNIGPVLAVLRDGNVNPMIPPIQAPGYEDNFRYRQAGNGGAADTYPELPIPPSLPVGDLPITRAMLTDGWVELKQSKQ
jgi:hypothetical protein